jgi:hypothetical protein
MRVQIYSEVKLMNTGTLILVIVVVLLLFGGGGYLYWR